MPLPDDIQQLPDADVLEHIRRLRKALGPRLVILAHHYQSDEIVGVADFIGDSLKLSQRAAQQKAAEYVVFCGVHFMAESADILTDPNVRVILPELDAGCDMADRAALDQVDRAWGFLTSCMPDKQIVPITYVNSTAAIKAFVGRHGGACCTSSNAPAVIDWALSHGDMVLFLPDQHLGRNTLYQMGHPLDRMPLYRPAEPNGGLTPHQIDGASAVLWEGACPVHITYGLDDCRRVRQADPACRILVHPECPWDVFAESDMAGSTEFIIETIDQAPAGSHWAIGTEHHLVDRLIRQYAGRLEIQNLSPILPVCETMTRITPRHLLWVLRELAEGRVVQQIGVDESVRRDALRALERMLALKASGAIKS